MRDALMVTSDELLAKGGKKWERFLKWIFSVNEAFLSFLKIRMENDYFMDEFF